MCMKSKLERDARCLLANYLRLYQVKNRQETLLNHCFRKIRPGRSAEGQSTRLAVACWIYLMQLNEHVTIQIEILKTGLQAVSLLDPVRFGPGTKKWMRTSPRFPARQKERSNDFCTTGDVRACVAWRWPLQSSQRRRNRITQQFFLLGSRFHVILSILSPEIIWIRFQDYGCVHLREIDSFQKIAGWFDCIAFAETNYSNTNMCKSELSLSRESRVIWLITRKPSANIEL